MRGKFLFAALIVTGAVALLVPVLLSHETATRVDTYSIRADVPYMVSPPVVPSEAVFAGDTVDLRRYDMRERMDRELMSFTYMHSSTMLIIKKANRLYPVIEPILKEQGVPDDLKYLMTIESNLNMRAVSPAGAAGLWQFMAGTARDNGLEVNANIDERYNVEKATRAACAHLKSLYERFGDWLTVGAAYNAGHGRIGGERTRQGREEAVDLWLNEETSRYMFRLLAIKRVMENPKLYGFLLKREQLYPLIPYTKDTVRTGIEDLAAYARSKGLTYAQLKDFNPWLRDRSLANRSGRTYVLTLPNPDALSYDPTATRAHDKEWVID